MVAIKEYKAKKDMKLSQFKFNLPEELIALYPHSSERVFKRPNGTMETFSVTRRDECRLMVLHKQSQTIDLFKKDADGNPIEGEYIDFRNVIDYFDDGDTFVLNDSKVFPARLYGTKEKTDARIEVFLQGDLAVLAVVLGELIFVELVERLCQSLAQLVAQT